MLLVADIGNTSTTLGLYKENKLVNSWKIASDKQKSEDEFGILLNNLLSHAGFINNLEAAAISSVVLPLTERFKKAIEKYLNVSVFVISAKNCTDIVLDVEKPKEVGADRIANAYAAHKIYKGPAIVVDFGTATTFDIIDQNGHFIGGIITPGIGISTEALSSFTSRLPKVKIEAPKSVVGKNTIDNMLSGLVRGHASMIEGLIMSIEEELGYKMKTIATGGYKQILTDCMKRPFDYLDPNLTLEGTKMLYELNNANICSTKV